MTHEQWQRQVVDLAAALGWDFLHVRKSVARGGKWATTTNLPGWPDLFLWHPRCGFGAIELKVGRDRPTAAQLAVLASLEAAGAAGLVAYPEDFDAVLALLHGTSPRAAPIGG